MFTVYLTLYAILSIIGIAEIATGWLTASLGLGVHTFLILFAVIFLIQTIILARRLKSDSVTKTKAVYDCHRMTLVLATLLVLMIWLLAI